MTMPDDDTDKLIEYLTRTSGRNGDGPWPLDEDVIDDGRYKRWSVTELLNSDLTYQWDAKGFLVRPTYGLDSGEMKTLKSYFGTARAIGLAGGVPILGEWHVPERRRVLIYVAEGGRIPFTRRFIRLCEAHGLDPSDLDGWLETIYDAGPLDSTGFRSTLRSHLTEFKPALVHLDPLYPFQPITVDSHRYTQVGLMLNEVQAICAEHETTMWVTAHMNQSGAGFDLKRISGAGLAEWGDSWCLLRHRENPDVDGGRFRLAVDVGSRQWGGRTYDVDLNIGHFDPETSSHDGPITYTVKPAGSGGDPDDDRIGKARLKARTSLLDAGRRARRALTKEEFIERAIGTKGDLRSEFGQMVDDDFFVEVGQRKNDKGGPTAPLYELAKEHK